MKDFNITEWLDKKPQNTITSTKSVDCCPLSVDLQQEIEILTKLVEETKNISDAKIISAVELSEDEKERIILKLEKESGKKIKAEYVVDKSIIGGIIIESDGKIIDGSLRYKLKDIKDVMGQ